MTRDSKTEHLKLFAMQISAFSSHVQPWPGRGRRPPTSSGMLLLTRGHLDGALLDDDGSDGRRLPRSPPTYGRRACLTLTTVDQEEAAKQASLDRDCFQALKLLPMLC